MDLQKLIKQNPPIFGRLGDLELITDKLSREEILYPDLDKERYKEMFLKVPDNKNRYDLYDALSHGLKVMRHEQNRNS